MKHAEKTDRLSQRLAILTVSFLASIIIWLYVQILNSSEVAFTLPVVERNLDENMVIVSRLGSVTVEARGKKDDLDKLDSSNLRAYVNLAGVRPVDGPVRVPVELDRRGTPLSIRWTIRRPNILVSLQPRVKISKPVEVEMTGKTEVDFSVPDATADPPLVDLYGLQQDVARVAKVRALLDLSTVKRGDPPTIAVEILDEQGRDLSDKVVSDPKRVTVRPIFVASAPRRYLPIVPTWAGALPAGYVFVRNHEVRPQQVQVSGDTAVVGKLFSLETEPINLTDIRGTRRVQVKLKTPRGVRLLGPASVTVTVYAAQAPARGG